MGENADRFEQTTKIATTVGTVASAAFSVGILGWAAAGVVRSWWGNRKKADREEKASTTNTTIIEEQIVMFVPEGTERA